MRALALRRRYGSSRADRVRRAIESDRDLAVARLERYRASGETGPLHEASIRGALEYIRTLDQALARTRSGRRA